MEMAVGEGDPVLVTDKTAKGVYVEVRHLGGRHTERIDLSEKVLKAPADYNDKEQEYTSDEYWLQQADRLGI